MGRLQSKLLFKPCVMAMALACACVIAGTEGRAAEAAVAEADASITHIYDLRDFGYQEPVRLQGWHDVRGLSFGVRDDEAAVGLQLHINYRLSPELLVKRGSIRVILNGGEIGNLVAGKDLHEEGTWTVDVDANLVREFNVLNFELIGSDCGDPDAEKLWFELGRKSNVVISSLRLPPDQNLARLPFPFFDHHDNGEVIMPFVFAGHTTAGMVNAAGVLASWLGIGADYRGAKFPVMNAQLPNKGNAVVLVAGGNELFGIEMQTSGPGAMLVPNPNDPYGLLLIVKGTTESELLVAAQTLAAGETRMSGSMTSFNALNAPPKREPYDAPRWIPGDRPVRFGELKGEGRLAVHNAAGSLMNVDFRIPPDMLNWRGSSALMKLKFHYTAREKATAPEVQVNFNDNFLKSFPLRSHQSDWSKAVKRHLHGEYEQVKLMPDMFGFYNRVTFQFTGLMDASEACSVATDKAEANQLLVEAQIDDDSTIDLSNAPHYSRMPNVGMFANGGFPFTRLADLSETAVVLPDDFNATAVSTYLQIMAMMGGNTGSPVSHVQVISAEQVDQYADFDLLLIGRLASNQLFSIWADWMPVEMDSGRMRVKELTGFDALFDIFDGRNDENDEWLLRSGGAGVLTSFESPLKAGRTVVAVTASDSNALGRIGEQMLKLKDVRSAHGDTIIIGGNDDVSVLHRADSYYIGELPFWSRIQWTLATSPLKMLLVSMLGTFLISLIAYMLFRRRSKRRLRMRQS